MFREARVDKVPEGTTHHARLTADDSPEFVHSAACITSYGQIFVHERGTRVFRLRHHCRVHLQLIGRWIARTDDFLSRMRVSVAAIHEVTSGVEPLAFFHHFGDERTFTALVASTPEEHAGVIAVAQHQLLHALQIHPTEPLVVRDVFRSMSFCTSLVDDIEAIFVSQFQVFVHRRIV